MPAQKASHTETRKPLVNPPPSIGMCPSHASPAPTLSWIMLGRRFAAPLYSCTTGRHNNSRHISPTVILIPVDFCLLRRECGGLEQSRLLCDQLHLLAWMRHWRFQSDSIRLMHLVDQKLMFQRNGGGEKRPHGLAHLSQSHAQTYAHTHAHTHTQTQRYTRTQMQGPNDIHAHG